MKHYVKTKIRWLTKEEGGRRNIIPIGIQYCPIIIFEDLEPPINADGREVLWSAEIYNIEINEKNESYANLSYLFDNAPKQFLQIGNRFNLYEGLRLVAKGVITAYD